MKPHGVYRTFEYDDYPQSGRRFLRTVDSLKERYPNFKCSVFAIPGAMTERHWRPLDARSEWIEVCPHGFSHVKRECRDKDMYSMCLHWLDTICAEQRYTKLWKAPWHGLDEGFMRLLRERGFDMCIGYMSWRVPFPTPDWPVWNLKDARTRTPVSGVHVEAHAISPQRIQAHARQHQQIDRRNIKRLTALWHADDEWEFVSRCTKPLVKKLYLGCGEHVWDDWDCLDPRSHLDPRIIPWEAPNKIPCMPERADIVLTSHMMNYLRRRWYGEFAKEIWRVLRPGGIVRMAEDATDSGYIWRKPGERARGTGTIRSLPTQGRVARALRYAGFKVTVMAPGETQSPHRDVLRGDTRRKRWERGHKYYLEGLKPWAPVEAREHLLP